MKLKMITQYNDFLLIHEYKSTWLWHLALFIVLIALPKYIDDYQLYILSLCGIYSIVSIGLNLLTGHAGQISLGHAAFFAIGAYSSAILTDQASLPFLVALPLSGLIASLIGIFAGLAAFRLTGLYLAIVTLGFSFIVEEAILRFDVLTHGANGYAVNPPIIFGYEFSEPRAYFYIILVLTTLVLFLAKNILRSNIGRSFVAIRDSEAAAKSVGINVHKIKLIAFGTSTFYAGIGGCLIAHLLQFIGPDNFTVMHSIFFLSMIIVGGLGSIPGSVLGAVLMTMIPEGIKFALDYFPTVATKLVGIESFLYGLIIIAFLIFEPLGFYGRWLKIKYYWEMFPFYKKETFKKQRKFYKTEKR
jgi:branched-chain amino acid transport system permease protein